MADRPQTYSLTSADVSTNPFREVSFSSYLNPAEQAFVRKLAQPGKTLSFNAEPKGEKLGYLGPKEEDGEIGVFEAEKYFNGEIDPDQDSPKSFKSMKKLETEGKESRDIIIEPVRPRVLVGTPSIRSESSLNSQNALLKSNTARNLTKKRGKKVNSSRRLFAALGCKCSCSDKGSVDVVDDENSDSIIVSNFETGSVKADESGKFRNIARKGCFGRLPVKAGEEEVIKPRKSLEVFGSPSLERRITRLGAWDAGTRRDRAGSDDTESDASSDLFEIESLTGKVNSYLSRQASDAAALDCPTPTTARYYAPSEASVEWSVVTASAADFSVMSDTEEPGRAKGGPERRRHRPGILLGCNSQKAVRVAGEAHSSSSERFGPDSRRKRDTPANPVARFQAETRLTGFDHKYGKYGSRLLYAGK